MQKAIRPLLRPDCAGSHAKLGYIIQGINAGPNLLVALPQNHASAVAEAFNRIPRLGDIRGKVVMVHIDAIGVDMALDAWLLSQTGPVDETLYLATGGSDGAEPHAVQTSLRAILRKATRLGMISGRGVVPLRTTRHGRVSVSLR